MVWVKRLGLLLASLIALLVAVIVYVVVFVDPNHFKGELQQLAKEKANVTLRMDGDIGWTFYPRISLSLEQFGVALGNEPEILSFSHAEFGVAVMPLLQRKIEVNTVRLVDLTANLKVDKNGKPNWQLENTVEPKPASTQADAESDDAALVIPDIILDELSVVNARILYEDAKANKKAELVTNLTFNDVKLNESWPMRLDAKITQSAMDGSDALSADVDFGADFTVFTEQERLSFENVVMNTTLEGKSLPASPLKADLKVAQLDVDVPQENALFEGVSLQTLGMEITGKLEAFQVLTEPEYNLVVDIDEFSPRDVLAKLNIVLPDMQDNNSLTSANFKLSAQGTKDSIKAQPIALVVDDTNIEANARINLNPLTWDISIAGANLDVDRYLPPVKEGQEKSATTDQAAKDAASDLFPVEFIRSLNGHVGLAFNHLKVKNILIDKLELDSTQANGKVRIAPAQMMLYFGSAELQALLDVTGETPKLTVTPKVDSIEILPLLKDFMALEKVRGATSLSGDLRTSGNQVDALLANLNGDLLVNMNDGALLGTNYTKMVCQGVALIRSESLTDGSFKEDTPFETMRFPAKIVNGVVSTPGLTMASLTLRVTGDGEISLPTSTLDYETKVAMIGSGLDQSCAVKESIANIEFPIACKGNFTDPAAKLCSVDGKAFLAAFSDKAKAQAQAKLDAEKARAEEKLATEKARAQAKLDEEKARLEEKKEEVKQELQDKLKSKLNSILN